MMAKQSIKRDAYVVGEFVLVNDIYRLATSKDWLSGEKNSRLEAAGWLAVAALPVTKLENIVKEIKAGNKFLKGVALSVDELKILNEAGYFDKAIKVENVEKASGAMGTGKNISHPVLDNARSGSALKKPDGQHGFNDIIDNYTPHAKGFEIVGGDGVKRNLYQIEGGMKYYDYKDVYNKDLRIKERITTVKDQNGIFEWIVDSNKGVTHRGFIPNGKITGFANQRP